GDQPTVVHQVGRRLEVGHGGDPTPVSSRELAAIPARAHARRDPRLPSTPGGAQASVSRRRSTLTACLRPPARTSVSSTSSAIALIVGIVDDFRGLPWYGKLAGQITAAAVATGFGIWVNRFTFPFVGIHTLPASVGIPLTIVWIVAIMNMFNFLDGLDGLAAGVAAIAGLTFSVIALSLGKYDAAVLSAIVFGACVGFLRHNFYPARIIMG